MTRLVGLVIKEFLAILMDPKSRLVIVVPPLVQLLVFGYAATFDITDVPFAVYDESRGAAARELVARFRGSRNFSEVATITNLGQIESLVDRRKVLVVVHIGPRFERELSSPGGAHLQVIVDGRDSNTALVALGYVRTIVRVFREAWIEEQGQPGLPARLEVRAWFNPNLNSRWFVIPGIVGLLTLVVTLLVTALSVAREREQGTFDQLLVAPYRPGEILVGKALPGLVIGLVEGTVIILVAVFGFGVPLVGSLVPLYTGLVLFLLSAIGVGLMISSFSVTQQQGLLGAFLFLVPSVILSGFATPIGNMPEVIQKFTYLNPLRYFMVILRSVFLEGASFSMLLDQFWPMAVIGLVSLAAATWLFRRRMG